MKTRAPKSGKELERSFARIPFRLLQAIVADLQGSPTGSIPFSDRQTVLQQIAKIDFEIVDEGEPESPPPDGTEE
jgi:hypothetical protein